MSHVRASQASYVVLPETVTDKPTVLSFLVNHFSQLDAGIWQQRIVDGKVHWRDGRLIELTSAFIPRERVYYYREVLKESKIPFTEKILYQDDNIIIAYKPHFLAVNPTGQFINECLVNRLRIKTGISTLVTTHRLDRAANGDEPVSADRGQLALCPCARSGYEPALGFIPGIRGRPIPLRLRVGRRKSPAVA